MKANLIASLRWIAVLPAAIASYLLGYALYKLLFFLQSLFGYAGDPDAFFNKYFVAAFSAGLGGFLFVFLASQVAPNYNKYAALTLLVVLAMVTGFSLFAGIALGYALSIVEAIASVVGGIIAYTQIISEEKT